MVVLTAFISPQRSERRVVRQRLAPDQFIEIFVDTAPEVCEARDPKGRYKKARAGEIQDFTRVNSDYQPPEAPDLRLDGEQSVTKLCQQIIELLRDKAIIAA